jgi:GT2 family glycosyltransferase
MPRSGAGAEPPVAALARAALRRGLDVLAASSGVRVTSPATSLVTDSAAPRVANRATARITSPPVTAQVTGPVTQVTGPVTAQVTGPVTAGVATRATARVTARLPTDADNLIAAVRWLERAHRLVPLDPNATLALASTCLAHDPARAAALFQSVADTHDVRQAWLGLAAARLSLAGPDAAAELLAIVLSRYAFTPDIAGLAAAIGRRPGSPGWCALRSDGGLEIHAATSTNSLAAGRARVSLDGKSLRGRMLPAGWERGRTIDVRIDDIPLLGSPIQVGAIRRLAGCVEAWDGGIRGWAWHPGDPEAAPVLALLDRSGRVQRSFVARDESVVIADTGPLARPRSFRLTRSDLLELPWPVHIAGPDGKDLPGSPLDPLADEADHVAAAWWLGQVNAAGPAVRTRCPAAGSPLLRADGPVPSRAMGADGRRRATTIVIPVHDGGEVVLNCLQSVQASLPAGARILVVDDGSSDPGLATALNEMVRQRTIGLLRHPRVKGFPAAANAGIRVARGRDVVLLNSDTLVPPGWLERLRAAAYASRDIGTVTPLSNDASILSYPGPAGSNPRPDYAAMVRLDRCAERANGGAIVDIPVGVGFCLYLRRDCLNVVGSFRADRFAQGYGEENDFCLRARRLGWRNVALTGLFVGHLGGTSFGGDAVHLRARNSRVLEQLHPGYQALIENYRACDPLAQPRRRIDLCRWRERRRRWEQAAILISHDDGGGVEQRLVRAIRSHGEAGRRPIVLRPAETGDGEAAIVVRDGAADDLPNLVYAVPRELPALLRLLRAARPEIIEAHHLADYPPAIYDLVAQLGVPYDVHVHDYAWFCPRVSLLGAHDRYCGEPDLPDCEICVADNGHFLKEDISVAALRRRSAAFLSAARRVVVPSDDTAVRMQRHFTGQATITVPHEDDASNAPVAAPRSTGRDRASVCVVGAIGVHKGYDILLACARDAVRRDLNLEFIVVGHTIDDTRMLATGRVFVTGRFEPEEAVSLIAAQNAQLGFVASICPETWCLSLGDIWRAGLPAAAFDIGAPAERIRRAGHGILLPLGLSASAINNTLVAVIAAGEH